jgi:hypothetical protein
MSAELAVPADGGHLDGSLLIGQMRAVRESMGTAPLADAGAAREKAELVRTWAKIKKTAADVALEAARLECTALRRMAQLGWHPYEGHERRAATWYAEMTDQDFSDFIRELRAVSSPTAYYQAARRKRTLARLSSGGTRFRKAAAKIVHGTDGPVTMAAMVTGLASELDIDADLLKGGPVPAGLRATIAGVIRGDRDDQIGLCPAMVTIRDAEGSWLHIRCGEATLGQYREMITHRQRQAAEVQQALEDLIELADRLARLAPDATDESPLYPLLERAVAVSLAEDWPDGSPDGPPDDYL